MRALVVLAIALLFAPAAAAKGKMSLALGDPSPATTQRVTVALQMETTVGPNAHVFVIAVAPGRNMYDLMSKLTQPPSPVNESVRIPRDGFGVDLKQTGPHRWRAFVRFPRAGTWQLVVPNWGGAPGYAMPPPIVRRVVVS
jgi:hypothetical protein